MTFLPNKSYLRQKWGGILMHCALHQRLKINKPHNFNFGGSHTFQLRWLHGLLGLNSLFEFWAFLLFTCIIFDKDFFRSAKSLIHEIKSIFAGSVETKFWRQRCSDGNCYWKQIGDISLLMMFWNGIEYCSWDQTVKFWLIGIF